MRLGGDLVAVLRVELGVERAAVDADADRARRGPCTRWATVLMCSGRRMLPGLRRRQCDAGVEGLERPAVLVVDVGDDRHRRAGHDLRPGPRPPRPRCRCSARCRRRRRPGRRSAGSVPSTSAVLVVVIDCTVMGAPPPTATLPTMIWRVAAPSHQAIRVPDAAGGSSTARRAAVGRPGGARRSRVERAQADEHEAGRTPRRRRHAAWPCRPGRAGRRCGRGWPRRWRWRRGRRRRAGAAPG